MTGEELGEDSFNSKKVLYKSSRDKRSYIDGFRDGLKVGKLKWHKVVDDDLPKYGYQVLSEKGVPVIYNRDINSWFEYSPNADNIKLRKWEEPIAWCEKPEFKEAETDE